MPTKLHQTAVNHQPKRLLLLLGARTYRAPAFIAAAENLGIEVIKAIDMDPKLAEYWDYPLGLQFSNPQQASQAIVEFANKNPIGAILSVDDSGSVIAALASKSLGLPHNGPAAALAARDKYQMRELLAADQVPSPRHSLHYFSQPLDTDQLVALSGQTNYPCVLKPLNLNGSRGVIRANNPEEFFTAARQLYRLLYADAFLENSLSFLVEEYIPGTEIALEGLLDNGRLQVLAIFDKPDPLEGPYFEESIYVTPSRLPQTLQDEIIAVTSAAAEAISLSQGPIHAELRIDPSGPKIIEIAGRSIGGLCSETLRFGIDVSLEEMILRQAFGLPYDNMARDQQASGVMMIPIPEAGILKDVQGCEAASAVPLIEGVQITAKLNNPLVPLPEGDSYLGFIFARGDSPKAVESALRQAHQELRFKIAPQLTLLNQF